MSCRRLIPLAAFAVGLLALGAACGGGDDKLPYDPENADDIAHDAVLTEEDLEKFGLELVAEDEFDDEDLEFGDTDTCSRITASIEDLRDDLVDKREGRARNEFEASGGNVPFAVTSTVNIFSETDIVDDTLEAYTDIVEGDDIEDCFREIFEETAAGFDIEIETVDSAARPPTNGASRAIAIKVSGQGETIEVLTEVYVWSAGNAGVTLTFTGERGEIDDDLIAQIVELQENRLEDAAEG